MLMDFLKGFLKPTGEPETSRTTEPSSSNPQNEPWTGFPMWPNNEKSETNVTPKNAPHSIGSLFGRQNARENSRKTFLEEIFERNRPSSKTKVNSKFPKRNLQVPLPNPYPKQWNQPANPFVAQRPPVSQAMRRPMFSQPFAVRQMQRFEGRPTSIPRYYMNPPQTFGIPSQSQIFGYPQQIRTPKMGTHLGISPRPSRRQFRQPWF